MTQNLSPDFLEQYLGAAAPIAGLIAIIAIVDAILKGWALWRAARMTKLTWFIALLIINSAGILPAIFLIITNKEYIKKGLKKKKA